MTTWLRILALCVVSAVLSTGAAQAQHKIKHAGFRTLYLMPIFVAIDRDIFKKNGLEVTFQGIESGALTPAVLLSGGADIVNDDLMGVVPLAKKGKELLMIYNLMDRVTMDLIVRKEALERAGFKPSMPATERAKVLKGLKIGITRPGAPTEIYARYLMSEAGLDPSKDADLIQIGGTAALSGAFRTGRIDAFLLSPPLPQNLEREGHGTIIIRNTAGEIPSLMGMSFITIYTTKDYAQKNTQSLKAYVRSLQEAVAWIRGNRDEALKMLHAKWFKETSPEALALSFDILLPAISPTGEFNRAGLEKFINVYKKVGEDVDIDLTEGGIWTNTYVKR